MDRLFAFAHRRIPGARCCDKKGLLGIVPMAWWDAVCALVATTATRLACAGLSRKNEQRLDAEADREVKDLSYVSLQLHWGRSSAYELRPCSMVNRTVLDENPRLACHCKCCRQGHSKSPFKSLSCYEDTSRDRYVTSSQRPAGRGSKGRPRCGYNSTR